jgi:integrase/recombinase XerD
MNQEPAHVFLWSEEKQLRLHASLSGMWAEDSWQVESIDWKDRPVCRTLCFTFPNDALKQEFKYAVWFQWTQGTWHRYHKHGQQSVLQSLRSLVTWLADMESTLPSFLKRPLEFWECSLRSWLVQTSQYAPRSSKRLMAATHTYKRYFTEDRRIYLFRTIYQTLVETYDDREKTEKDLWDLRTFGVPLNLSQAGHKLNFMLISQAWLRALVKRYLEYVLAVHSASNAQKKFTALQHFSSFLAREAPQAGIADLDRALILLYLNCLREQQLASVTWRYYLGSLRAFLETCAHRLQIPGLPRELLIFDDDFPPRREGGTREIPAEVLVQLSTHLKALPTTLLRMVAILLSVGLRVNELCQLPINCLITDDKHEWYLRFYQSKTRRELVIPLVEEEVIGAIQVQQQEVRARWGETCPYLFPSPSSPTKPYLQATFRRQLNEWALQCQITDRHQHPYHFTAHQFRHTVGMRLINENVPLEVISRLLGHRSVSMTQVYARVRDQKLRADLERVARARKTVDYQGKTVKGDPRANDPAVQMVRQGVRGQTLPVGGCGRLVVLGDCTHANKCLTCPMWLTSTDDLPALKSFYDRALRLKQQATTYGNQMVVEQQGRIIPTLVLRIKSLEDVPMDGSLGVDEVLAQFRTDLTEAECGLEEAQTAGLVLAARHLERTIKEMKMRIVALEVPDDRPHEQ